MVEQEDLNKAVNKTTDAQLEAETALERAEKAERTAKEIRQLTRKLLERMRKLERQVIGHEQMGAQLRPMTSTSRARRECRSTYDTQHSSVDERYAFSHSK